MAWDGDERRRKGRPNGNGDHDVLIRIDANLSNFMKRFDSHEVLDDRRFDGLFKRTAGLQRFMWLLMGAFAIIQFLASAIKAGWFK